MLEATHLTDSGHSGISSSHTKGTGAPLLPARHGAFRLPGTAARAPRPRIPGTRLLRKIAAAALFLPPLFLVPAPLSAELVWSPVSGWSLEDPTPSEARKPQPPEALQLMNEARQFQEDNRRITALRRYRRVQRRFPDSVYAPESYFQSARIRLERRQWNHAFDALDTIARQYPQYHRFNEVIGLQFEIAVDVAEGARFPILWVIPGFRNMERAVDMLDKVVTNAPYSEYGPVALAYMAQVEKNRGRPEDAIDAYERLITDYPDNLLTPDAYLGLANAHAELVTGPEYDQGSTRKAISYFEDFMILYPDSPYGEAAEEGLEEMRDVLARSKLLLGDFYNYRRRNYVAARVFYNEAITVAPDSPGAVEARERLESIEDKGAGRGS